MSDLNDTKTDGRQLFVMQDLRPIIALLGNSLRESSLRVSAPSHRRDLGATGQFLSFQGSKRCVKGDRAKAGALRRDMASMIVACERWILPLEA